MLGIELACVGILLVYVLACGRDRRTLVQAAGILAGAWLGEDTCIRAYGFYQYAPGWHLWLDRVPVMIVLIWPAVVLSARRIASVMLGARATEAGRLALVTGVIVVFDAALIEPIAVHAHLWDWNEPGIFGVPPIGILGWGFYAAAITWGQERRGLRTVAVLVAPVLTHVALLAAWWGAVRWFSHNIVSPEGGTLTIAIASVIATMWVVRTHARLGWNELLTRGVATAFFVVLLVRGWDTALGVYAAAFTLPHLVLCAQSAGIVKG